MTYETVYPTIPVTDLARSKDFYQSTVGLAIEEELPQGIMFTVGNNRLYIYQRSPTHTEHTLAGFRVDNLEAVVEELTAKGVSFEQYDFPSLKTDEKGIATTPPVKAAWFKDPDGNILGITQQL